MDTKKSDISKEGREENYFALRSALPSSGAAILNAVFVLVLSAFAIYRGWAWGVSLLRQSSRPIGSKSVI